MTGALQCVKLAADMATTRKTKAPATKPKRTAAPKRKERPPKGRTSKVAKKKASVR